MLPSIGIIGGADGPTAVFVSGGLSWGWLAAAALALRCGAYRLYTLLGVGTGFALYQCSIGTTVRFLKGRFRKLSEKAKN